MNNLIKGLAVVGAASIAYIVIGVAQGYRAAGKAFRASQSQ